MANQVWIYPQGLNLASLSTFTYGYNEPNLFLDDFNVPANGWIIAVAADFGGAGNVVNGAPVIYDGATTPHLLFTGQVQSWPDSPSWRFAVPTQAVRVAAGQSFNAGYFRESGVYGSRHTITPTGPGYKAFIVPGSSPPATASGYQVLSGSLAIAVLMAYNSAPLIGLFDSPTPDVLSTTSDRNPVIAGTMPHGDDTAYDSTNLVQWQINDALTNTPLFSGEFTPTPTENLARRFERRFSSVTTPVSLPTGVVEVLYRHRDEFGVWSPWSNEAGARRVFTVVGGPSPPAMASPAAGQKFNTAAKPTTYTGSYDSPTSTAFSKVRIELWNDTKIIKLYDSGDQDSTVGVAPVGGTWSVGNAWHADLAPGLYYVRALVKDSTGTYSTAGNFESFRINAAPTVPVYMTPGNGQISPTGILSATAVDPDGDPITAGIAQLYDLTALSYVYVGPSRVSTTVYAQDAFVTPSTKNGFYYRALNAGKSTVLAPTFPTTLNATVRDNSLLGAVARSTVYSVGNQVLKPSGTSANDEWYECTTGGITAGSAPTYPTTNGATITDGTAVFTCRKTIVWRNEGVDVQFPLAATGDNYTASYDASARLVNGHSYLWAAKLTDSYLYGDFGYVSLFGYAAVPTVTLLAPHSGPLTNLVQEPSAEYPEGAFWTDSLVTGTTLQRVKDGDAYYGEWAWSFTRTATTPLGGQKTSAAIPVSTAKSYVFAAAFEKEVAAGASNTRLAVDCYSVANALLGRIYPDTWGGLADSDLTTSWTQYGGFLGSGVSGKTFPAGTTYVKLVIEGSWSSITAVRWDAVLFTEAPLPPDPVAAHPWFGFFDGDFTGFGVSDDYIWIGAAGYAPSQGPPVLTSPSPNVQIGFSSGTGATKAGDRLYIEWFVSGVWLPLYTAPTYAGGTRVSVPVPPIIIKSHSRYRLRVEAIDSNGLVGSTAWQEFVATFDGPAEVPFESVTADQENARIIVRWSPTQINTLLFVGTEIAFERVSTGERITVAVIRDPTQTQFTYQYPLAREDYQVMIRQTALVGLDVLQSRWNVAHIRLDYDDWVIKDLEEPSLFLKFPEYGSDSSSDDPTMEWASFREWGATQPVHFPEEGRVDTGSVTARFLESDPNKEAKINTLKTMRKRMTPVAIMKQRPAEVTYAVITGLSHNREDTPWYASYDISWETTEYIEDAYIRETQGI